MVILGPVVISFIAGICIVFGRSFDDVSNDDFSRKMEPKIVSQSNNRITFSNTRGYVLTCDVPGQHQSSVSWHNLHGDELQDISSLRTRLTNGSLWYHAFSGHLYRADVHSSTVRCHVTTDHGTAVSAAVKITAVVNQPYRVVVNEVSVDAGATAVFWCRVIPSDASGNVQVIGWRVGSMQMTADYMSDRICTRQRMLLLRHVSAGDASTAVRCQTEDLLTGSSQLSDIGYVRISESTTEDVRGHLRRLPDDIVVQQEEDIVLFCPLFHSTFKHVRWYRGRSMKLELTASLRLEVGSDYLLVRRAYLIDSDLYHCVYEEERHRPDSEEQMAHTFSVQVIPNIVVEVTPAHLLMRADEVHHTLTCHVQPKTLQSDIRWLRNGRSLDGGSEGRSVIPLDSGEPGVVGVYQCLVAEHVATAVVDMIAWQPRINDDLIDQAVHSGESATLTCTVTGHPTPEISWKYQHLNSDAEELPTHRKSVDSRTVTYGKVISQLTISPVLQHDAGIYTCSGENDAGKTHRSTNLNVYGSAAALPRRSMTIAAKSHTLLHCPVTGFPLNEFSWRRNGVRLDGFAVLANGSLLADGRVGFMSGEYSCEVTGGDGTRITGFVDITVLDPPEIAPFTFPHALRTGQRTQGACSIISGHLPIEITWLKDHKPVIVETRANNNAVSIVRGEFFSNLVFNNLKEQHAGIYTCRAANSVATQQYSAKLSILVAPRWLSTINDVAVLLGGDVLFNCSVFAVPAPSIEFQRHQTNISDVPSGSGVTIYADNKHVHIDQVTGVMTLSQVSQADAGLYSCSASNRLAPVISQTARVIVQVPARFAVHRRNLTVPVGESVNLTCTPTGDQPIRFSWLRENEPISGQNDASPVLTLTKVERKHSGHYTCVARNTYDSDRVTWEVFVTEPPEAPAQLGVSHVTSRSFNVMWSAPYDGHSSISSYLLQCAVMTVNPSFTTNDHRNKVVSASTIWKMATNFTLSSHQRGFLLTDLQPSTEYRVRMMAINSQGSSQPSHVISVLTMTEPPGGPPLNLRVRALSSTRIAVSWSPLITLPVDKLIHGYIVKYRSATAPSEPLTREVRRPEPSVVLRNLQPNTAYNVQVIAFNEAGAGPPSVTVSVTTLQDVPRVFPGNVTCQNGTSAALWLTWQPLPGQLSSGTVVGYRIVWRKLHLRLGDVVHVDTSDTEQFRLDGLDSYTDYLVMVSAATSVGVGPNCPPVVCTTAQSVPQPPARVKAARLWDGSSYELHIVWEPPLRANGVLLSYTVYIQDINDIQRRTVDASRRSLNLNSVLAGAIEGVWISASNTAGESRFSSILTGHMIKTARVGILSFSTRVAAVVTRPVTLDCITSRQSAAAIWKHNQRDLVSSHYHRLTHLANGSLLISHVTRSDEGDWSCSISSGETITVQLHPVTPPTVTSPQVVMATQSTLKVAWQLIDDGGMPIQRYHIRYGVRGSGEWRHLVWLEGTTEVLLVGLLCGTEYSVTVSADNTLTGGQHSQPLLAATNGNKPVRPPASRLVTSNSSCVIIRLYDWSSQCDVTGYSVTLTALTAGVAVAARALRHFSHEEDLGELCHLQPAVWYHVEISAHSQAGNSTVDYQIATTTAHGERLTSPPLVIGHNKWHLSASTGVYAIVSTAVAVVSLAVAVACFIKSRRSRCSKAAGRPYRQESAVYECPKDLLPGQVNFHDEPGLCTECHKKTVSRRSVRKHCTDISPYATLDLTSRTTMSEYSTQREEPTAVYSPQLCNFDSRIYDMPDHSAARAGAVALTPYTECLAQRPLPPIVADSSCTSDDRCRQRRRSCARSDQANSNLSGENVQEESSALRPPDQFLH